ncbi:hypothetical protein XAC3610_11520002 [Xanthomonas citri pv. citri]|nr:hypothetical protein XAC3610_11520002 [Xanthomonas citri pv. citri]CEH50647.1 hypothetical protein XACLD7_14720001 [Xanthomonas citri pv. citri]
MAWSLLWPCPAPGRRREQFGQVPDPIALLLQSLGTDIGGAVSSHAVVVFDSSCSPICGTGIAS